MVAHPVIPGPLARHAFTLLEVLLTLCLLVILASMTWPVLSRPLANQRLRKAADQVQMEWVRARVKAMSNGCVYLFHYAAESDGYSLQSQLAPESVTENGLSGGAEYAASGAEGAAGGETRQRRLPEGIRFMVGETALDSRAQATLAQPTAPADEAAAWAMPIYFYPDGITSTATLRLVNEYGFTIEVSLRGLTGIATVGPVQAGGGPTP